MDNTAFSKTPYIPTWPDSSNNVGTKLNKYLLKIGRDIINDRINTNIGNLTIFIIGVKLESFDNPK